MSNFSNTRKLNAVYKDTLALVNTNSSLEYYDEVNIGASYRNTVDVSNIKIDTVPASPDFTLFPSEMNTTDFARFGITLATDSGVFPGAKKYQNAKLDNTQTVIKFERVELVPVGNSVDMNGGSFYFLDDNGKNLLEDMIPYTSANSIGQLDDAYDDTKIEYSSDGSNFTNILLQTNYHGTPILNHRQGLLTFNTNPSWSLKNGVSVDISNAGSTTNPIKVYLTFYKYVGKKGIRVLNSTDVSGGLVVGGEYSLSGYTAPNDGAIIQGNVGIGTLSPDKKLHISDDTILDSVKISNISNDEHIGLGYQGIVKYQTGTFTLGLANNDDLKFITNDTERMRIKGGGNVGIGLTNPAAPLEVYGGDNSTSTKQTWDTLTLKIIRGGGEHPNDKGYGARLKFSHNANSMSSTGENRYVSIESVSEFNYSNHIGLRFLTRTGTPTERMRISATGNVGIGTSTPAHKLDVSNGDIRIINGRLILDKTNNDDEGGEVQIASQTSGNHNGYWVQDSIQDKFRILGNGDLAAGSTALLINTDTTNGLYKVGINKAWNYTQTEALDVSGNIRIDNGNNTQNSQGGKLIFDDGFDKAGPNKILLHSSGYGIGVDQDTVKYIAGGGQEGHKWYYSGSTSNNGTLGMTLNMKDLTVEQHITGKGDLTLPTHKLSTNTYTVYESSITPTLTFNGINGDNTSTTSGNVALVIKNINDDSSIKLNSSGDSYFNGGNVAIGKTTASERLDVNGNVTVSENITSTAGNLIANDGTITQVKTSGTNTFTAISSNFSNRVQVNQEITANKIVAGKNDFSSYTAIGDHDLLITKGDSGSSSMRLNKFGTIEFTKHYATGGGFGNNTENIRCADWKIQHTTDGGPSSDGESLAFTFKRHNSSSVPRTNTVLKLCPSSHNSESDPNSPESGNVYNALFNGDVHIDGNLIVTKNTTARDTVVETSLYNAGIAVPSTQTLRLSDDSGASKLRFDLKSDGSTKITHNDTLSNNDDNGKIFLAEGARISVPDPDTIGYHVWTNGSHRFYTTGGGQNNQMRLRIDNTNNVVIGSSDNGSTDTLDYSTTTGRTPSLLNLWNSSMDNSKETMIQFSNGNTGYPFRIGIRSGATYKNKFSFLNNADEDIFTIDAEKKKIGIRTNGLTSSDSSQNTNAITGGTATANDPIVDISGNLAVSYLNDNGAGYFGWAKIGKIKDNTSACFGNVSVCTPSFNGNTSIIGSTDSYALKQDVWGNTTLNCMKTNNRRIEFAAGDSTFMVAQVKDDRGCFALGGWYSSNNNNFMDVWEVDISHNGTTRHIGDVIIRGDLSFNTLTSNHNITMDDINKIKLDSVTINGDKLTITPTGATQSQFYSEFYETNTGNTTIRGGKGTSNIIIGDINYSEGKIYLGHNNNSNTNSDYFIQSRSIALSENTNNNSLYTQGNVNIAGNLNMIGNQKQINIGTDTANPKLTIANGTGDVISHGNLSLNNDNSTDNYFKIHDSTNNEKFSVQYLTGNTDIAGTLNVSSQPFTVGGTVNGGGGVDNPKFEVYAISGATTIKSTLTIDGPDDGTGIQLNTGDLVIKNQKIQIIETDQDANGNDVVSFEVDDDGNIITGTWNAAEISTTKGGLGADVSNPATGQILVAQSDGTYQPITITPGTGMSVTSDGTLLELDCNVSAVALQSLDAATLSTKGLMSADDKAALSIIRDFMFENNVMVSDTDPAQATNKNKLHEGLVRKVKTYRTKTHYNWNDIEGTMSKLYVGPFLYDINKPTANYNDYDMSGVTITLDSNIGGNDTIQNSTISDTNILATNFSQEPFENSNSVYRVLFWQDYVTTSAYSSLDIEFICPYHQVDFDVMNYKYNTKLYVQDYNFNPISGTRTLSELDTGKILAEGISQVKNGRGPRGQMFPLNGHLNTVAKGTNIRILVLVNTVDGDTDSTARLDIDARNAYLKVTELNDTNATA